VLGTNVLPTHISRHDLPSSACRSFR
jgi:hypothetical protein